MDSNYLKIKKNIHSLRKAGILERYLDGNTRDIKPDIDYSKVPFSKYYNTYKEYIQDLDKLLEDAFSGAELNEDTVNKIADTDKELGINC